MKLLRAARYSSALLLVPICVAISSYASPASAQPAVAGGGGHSLFVAADGSA